MEKTKGLIFEVLRKNNISFNEAEINENGVEITKNIFVSLLEVIRENSEYSSVRGHVKHDGRFNVSYETNYLSYERWLDELYLRSANISYANVAQFKLFVSHANWIDFHLKYNEESYATVVIVPKPKNE